jgi:ankyrin repeat protein
MNFLKTSLLILLCSASGVNCMEADAEDSRIESFETNEYERDLPTDLEIISLEKQMREMKRRRFKDATNFTNTNPEGTKLLITAIGTGRETAAKLLIKKGANVNAAGPLGYTPLLI